MVGMCEAKAASKPPPSIGVSTWRQHCGARGEMRTTTLPHPGGIMEQKKAFAALPCFLYAACVLPILTYILPLPVSRILLVYLKLTPL